jgi:pimeloyl-ACP methyl ester carboxylesterase
MKYLRAGDWTFRMRTGGPEAGRAALLLHGFPQHGGEWEAVATRLHAAGRRTIAPDQRGYSPLARPADVGSYRIGELVADVVAMLDGLGLASVDLVGHDWGAVVGWHTAARFPARVRTLTAVSIPHPVAFSRAVGTDPDQQRRSAYFGLFRIPGKAEETLLADDATALRGLFAGSGLDEAGVDSYVAPMTEPGALTAALNWYRAMGRGDVAGFGPITCPTTLVWADDDVAVARSGADATGEHVDGPYRLTELTGVSHWIPDQAPDAVAEAVLNPPR